MRNPSREPQPPSWREIVVKINRGFRRGRDANESARKARARWIAGGLLCVALAAGISLPRHGGKKKDSAARKTRSPLGDTVSAGNTAKSVVSVEKTPKPEKRHSSRVLIPSAQKIKGSETPSPKVEVERRAAVAAPPRQIVLAPPLSAPDTTEGVIEDSDVSRKRGSWFFDQRAYPIKHIPEGALQRAIEQRDAMKAQQQPAAGPQTGANGIISFPGDALWHLMGPQPVNEPFTGTNTGYPTASGRVTAIAVDPSTPSTVYIGGAAGGVWKTTDGGTTWTPLTDSQPSLAVGSIAIDPNSCSPAPCTTIYVGTGEDNFNGDAFYGAGVLKSTNGGNTWTQFGGPFAGAQSPAFGGAQIGAIAVQPGNSNVVLAAAYFFDGNDPRGGIYRSTDGGATWSLPTTGAKGSAGTGVVFESSGVGANPPIAWAALGDVFSGASSNGIWKSTDLGVTWTLQTSVLPTVNVGRITLGYAANTTGATATLYAAIADSSTTSNKLLGLFKTTNGGTTWSALTGPTVTGGFCASQCFYDMAVGVQPTNASVVVLGGGPGPDNFTSLFESQDGGTTWTPSGTSGSPSPGNFANGSTTTHVHVDTHAVVFAPNGGTLYVGDDGGIWSTTTPTPASTVSPTWTDLNGGLAITQFYPGPSAGISDDNYGLGGTQDNDTEIFTGALGWTNAFTCGDGGSTAIDPAVPTTVYTTCDRGAQHVVNKSVFNGALLPNPTFKGADSGISHGDRMQFIPPLTIDENNPKTLYFGTFRVYQTNDGAATWTAISGDLGAGVGNITTFDVAHQSSSIVVTGTSTGKVWESLTATAGVASTWTEIDNGQLPNRHITSVRTERSDATGNIVFATLSGFGSCLGCAPAGHVFVTTNATSGAPTWTNISGDLPDIPVNDLIVFHQGSPAFDALYAATDVGVFSCTNPSATLCANWTVIGDGLPNSPVLGLAMRRPSRILRAATHGRSMWQIQLTDVSPGPLATITSVTPATAFVGDPATAVTINGFNFSANTAVFLNGVSVGTPTFVSTTQLNVTLASSFFQTGGVFSINLMDPAGVDPSFVLGAGGAPFTVMNPILGTPTLTNPTTSAGTPYTMHFTGSNFVNSTAVTITTFGNLPLTGTASSNGTVFDVAVPAALLTTAMPVSGTITNPVPGGGPTPAFSFNFTINAGTIVFNPSPIALTTFLGTTSSPVMNVAVINTSASSATITMQSITGTNAANFSFAAPTSGTSCNFPTSGQSGTGTITLAANGTCNFGITYFANPATPGNAVSNATLSVTDTASGSPQTAPIQGTPIPATVLLAPVNFGAVPVGTTSTTMNATLSNFSGSSISVTSAFTVNGTNQADFNIVPFVSNGDGNSVCPTTVPFPLASGASCDVSLAFTPSLPAGNESAQLNVTASVAVTTSTPNLIGIGVEVTSISPSIVAAGGPAFTLTVSGGGFAPSAVVNVNGSARLTTFVSATQLLASIPASDIATAGTLAITVTTPVPGGTTSEPKTLFVEQALSATNDNINFAINASTTPFRITQDTTQATTDTGGVADPTPCAPASKAKSVWFKFVAPASGRVVADTRFSSYTTILSAWTGTPGSLVAVASACASGDVPAEGASPAQSLIGFNVTSGTTYFVMVTDANTGGPGGTLTFSLDFAGAAPANDDNATPTVISATPFSNTVNSILATANTNAHVDPTLPGGCATGAVSNGQANSVWYTFTPSSNGTITADTLTSPYETILNVTSGTPNGTQVACNQSAAAGIAQSQVSFAASSGTPYFFMISSVLGDGGTTNFHLAFSAVSAPGVSFSPTNIAFGNQKVGTTSATNNVTITNNGTATLNITGITLVGANPGDFSLGAPTTGTACPLGASSLTAGSNCAVGVAFKPAAAGARSASVSVADNASGSPQTVPLTGTGTVPVASLAPPNIAFGNQTINTTSATNNVTVSNTGQASMNITSITLTGANPGQFALVAPTTGTACSLGASVLNAGSNCTVGVQFAPTALASDSANVSVADDAAGSPQTVPLTGTGVSAPAPAVTLSPTSISFGNQKAGTTSAAMSATLTNTGNANLNITAVSIGGANAGDFTSSGTTCTPGTTVLTPTQSCTLGATFTPTASGARSAAFSITDNASGSPHSLPLSGTGTVPGVGLAPANIAFGNQAVSTTSATNNITLTNSGNATLNITSITLTGTNPGQFSLGAPTTGTACPLGASSLAAGSACSVGVKFAPTATGPFAANVSFADDASGSPQTVGLTGTGTAPAVTFAPANVAFGNQRTGTSSAVTNVTITNSGTAALNITGITLTGTNPGDFSLGAPTTGTACALGASSLNAGSNCAVGVTFKPTATGARSANVSVADDASGSPQSVPLTGTGVASAVTFAPVNVAFGNQRTGTTSAVTNVTLTNSGTATLNITSITLTGTNPGDFTLGAPTTGTACALGASSLTVSSSCAVGVAFKPTATGARSANISVVDDAPGSPQTVPLTGTGTASAVTLAPTSVAFGNQVVSTQSAVTNVMITNGGTATLNITGITLTGTNPGDFSLGAPTTGTACGLGASALNAGSNCSFGLSFGPTATGARSASVSIADDASGSPQTVALTGTGTAANVTLSPSPVNFSNQRINTSSGTTTVTLSNTGNATVTLAASNAVTITGTNAGDFVIVAATGTNCSNNLVVAATNGTCVIGVTFTPTATGPRTATLQVSDNATPGTQSVTLNGTGTVPTASVAPLNISFGNQRKGTTSTGTDVTVSNTGTDTLNISSIALTGANPSQFTLGAPSTGTACSLGAAAAVAPGGNCKFSVKFAPTATGAQAASVTITDDSGAVAGTAQTVTLSGTGTLPQASAAPNPLAFGNQRKGTTSGAKTVTLTNTGTDTLNLAAANAVVISGANAADFAIVAASTTCKNSSTVAPNGSTCVINITFAPTTTAAEAATLTITDDSGGVAGTTQVVSVTGTGVLPQAGAAPSTLAFGNQPKGITSAPMTVTLTNNGTDTLNLAASNAVAISGTNAADFAVVAATTTCTNGAAIAASTSCVVNVTFAPSTTAAESATLTITDDSGGVAGSSQTVSLTGTGTTATINLTPNPVPFGNQRKGTSSSAQTITVTNSGNGSVTLAASNAVALSGANAADFAITGGTCANSLVLAAAPGPGNTCTITATFTPSTAAVETATVTVSFQGGTPAAPDTLNGTGIFPAVTLTPNTPLSFGNQIITTTSGTQSVTVKNTGTDTLNLSGANAVALGGANAAEFTTTGTTCANSQAIPVNGTCNIVVAFSPATAGAKSATVTITDDVSPAQVINLGGTGVTSPTATLSAATLTFAAQHTGTTSAAQSVTVTNSGGANLNIATVAISGTNASDFAIATGTTCTNGSTINGGASNSCLINVTFAPSAVGARTATITITDNADATGAPGAAQTIVLNGTGKAPAITFTPASVPNFGNQRIGTASAATTVTITNSGTDTLNLTSITITGTNASEFTVAGSGATPCPTGAGSLNATLSCTIAITFQPTATGPGSASVNVTDDASGSPQSLALAGTGTAPAVTLSAASITFPTTAVNSTSAVQSATVTNSGTATLTLGAAAVAISGANAGDFAIASGTTCTNGATVAVSASCTANFTFKPTAAGVRNATATITDDAGGAPGSSTSQTITLSGSTPSTAALSSSTVAFGNQGVGVASSAQTITITNNGGAKLNLAAANAVAISGTNPGDFAVASGTTCANGASVSGSGGTCIINLTFTPGATGARGPATIVITDDAGGVANSTQTVTLTGTGIDFTLAVTTGSQAVKAGSPATFTFTVTPGGGGFPTAITFATSALPRGAMGAFNPATLTAPITTQQSVTLTISTTSRGAAPPVPAAPRVPPVLIFRVLTILFAFLALLIMRRGLRTRRLVFYVPLVLVLAALAVSAGCVGGNANGTPPGTTQVTVTATAGSLTHATTVSLTVN